MDGCRMIYSRSLERPGDPQDTWHFSGDSSPTPGDLIVVRAATFGLIRHLGDAWAESQ